MRLVSLASILSSSIALTLVACGGGGGDDGQPAGPDAGPPSIDAAPGEVGTFTAKWGPKTIHSGVEDTECVQVHLNNTGPIKVHEIHNVLGLASHHFIVYRTNSTEEYSTPRPCNPFIDTLDPTKGAPLMITQRSEETLTLPDDVAFTLQPNQMVRLELHYVNTTDSDVTVQATTELRTEALASIEADFLFIGTPDISLPPNAQSDQTVGPTYIQMPDELQGVNVFALTGHTHKLGTDVQVSTAHDKTDAGTMVYDPHPFTWSEPETVYQRPAFTIPEGFRFTCKYRNTTDATVKFGESTTDEMCFFWAYYYPSHGAKVCMHTNQAGGANGLDVCCPGNPLCSLLPTGG
ncbi:MAG TPA: hypothetical protein VHE35_07575 [Kofleriaceae bacterium]|nr:hypothetical protein [Kofleriaceae bacterium]